MRYNLTVATPSEEEGEVSVQGISTSGVLIVIQVVFGSPLRNLQEFRSGDVATLTNDTIGTANHIRTLNKLVDLGWLSVRYDKEKISARRRPSTVVYRRTELGEESYAKLKLKLAEFGIILT